MFGTRAVYLLLAFIVSLMVSQPVEWVLGSAAQMAPGGLVGLLMLAMVLLSAAVEFWAVGVLFTLLSGLDWKRAAAWTVAGTAAVNFLCDGRQALSPAYFAAHFLSVIGLAQALAAAAAGAFGCWWLEQREHAQWVEQGRALILSMIGQ